MKVILEFNLPEDAFEHKLALDGGKWMTVCSDIDQWLRSIEKYGNRDTVSVSEVRNHILEKIDSSGLSFEQ